MRMGPMAQGYSLSGGGLVLDLVGLNPEVDILSHGFVGTLIAITVADPENSSMVELVEHVQDVLASNLGFRIPLFEQPDCIVDENFVTTRVCFEQQLIESLLDVAGTNGGMFLRSR